MTNEQAIRILEGNKNFYERIIRPYDREMVEALNMAIKALEKQPSEWIISEIRCPNCLEYFQTDCYSKEELKKCPICGARMEAENE